MLSPSQFCERRILTLTDVMEFVGVTIGVPWRETFADKVGIVIIFPFIPICQLYFQPLLSAIESRPIDISANQGRTTTDNSLLQSCPDIDLSLFLSVYVLENPVGPPALMANPIIFFSCHNIDTTQLLSHLQFRYLQITNIQTISLPQRNPEDTHEGIFDVLPVVDLNGVVERGDDLDFHSGLDVDAVAAFAAFGSYFIEGHNQFSVCGSSIYSGFD